VIKRALVVIDVQNEYLTGVLPIAYPPVEVALDGITKAMDAASAAGIPVVTVQHDMPAEGPVFAAGSDNWALHPEIANRPTSHNLRKELPSAFAGTDLHDWLGDHDIDTVTFTGFMTQHCVDSSAREALHRGYTVEVLSDATGTVAYNNAAGYVSAQTLHDATLIALHGGIASVVTTEEWVAAAAAGAPLPLDNPVSSAAAALAAAR